MWQVTADGLARFDGAVGAAIARADALPDGAARAVLAPCSDDPPILSLAAATRRLP